VYSALQSTLSRDGHFAQEWQKSVSVRAAQFQVKILNPSQSSHLGEARQFLQETCRNLMSLMVLKPGKGNCNIEKILQQERSEPFK